MARLLTCASAVVHAAVAIAVYEIGLRRAIVDTVLGIAGFAIGLLLGLYALGMISQRVSQGTALAAFVAGVMVTCAVAFGTTINSYWYTLVGSTTIVTVGVILSLFLDAPVAAPERN
jgi:hypothetical protein